MSLLEIVQRKRQEEQMQTYFIPDDPIDPRFCACGCGRRLRADKNGRPNRTGYSGKCPMIKTIYRKKARART